jgi:hypothetical protein
MKKTELTVHEARCHHHINSTTVHEEEKAEIAVQYQY